MQKKHVIAGLLASALLFPTAALAQDASLEAQVKSLMSQIQSLQLQLKTLLASSSPMKKADLMREDKGEKMGEKMHMAPGQMAKERCIMLNRNLRTGSQGEDVKKLQEMLAEDPANGFMGKATGFFGPLTANAMAKFQHRLGIASSTDGTVGTMTRGFLERACGKGLGMQDDGMHRAEVAGEITAAAASSITVTMREGKTRVVNVVASTTISVFSSSTSSPTVGTMADLTVGKMVRAEGAPQADGSLTARHIKVEPKK